MKHVFFDLDGTLLPMDVDRFMKSYFSELAKALCPLGISSDALIKAVWAGTEAMVKNDGSVKNEDRFWKVFSKTSGQTVEPFRKASNAFYAGAFNNARGSVGKNPLAAEAVRLAGQNGRSVVLATNPLFPLAGQRTRLGWIGLNTEDFALVTSYESDHYCKPNPAYYLSICERIGAAPEECLMVGNDEREDMYAASQAGLSCYLITDCVIRSDKHPWNGPQGTFAEMLEMLRGLN